ncbi:uncharacterized protein An11g05220 [Aspergillus niger]|uniref:Contig An11c0210, genomic contig n=2 Tax=Aspergillus niger TaxID=5061 RepID=A2QWH9_ASPNC|nr:uncharacterized protein An11g05220 [Aspergillus niger]CAL00373.1 unnamed protein product [Aspergillus niger]
MVDGGWLEHGGSGMRDDQRRSAGGNDDGVMMDRVDGDGDEGMCFPIGVVGSSSVMGDGPVQLLRISDCEERQPE